MQRRLSGGGLRCFGGWRAPLGGRECCERHGCPGCSFQHASSLPKCARHALAVPKGNDISADIAVTDATCGCGGSGGLCWPCDLAAVEQGRCLPGRYTLNFTGACPFLTLSCRVFASLGTARLPSHPLAGTPVPAVIDDGGASSTAQLHLTLVQRFVMRGAVCLFASDAGAAGADAAAAAAGAVAQNATLMRQLAAAVKASLAPALALHDVNLTAAAISNTSVASAVLAAADEAGPLAALAALGSVALLDPAQARQLRRRMAEAAAPPPAPLPPALQLEFSLEALIPSPLLYVGATAPAIPAEAAAQLVLQPIDAVFSASLAQSASAICTALAALLAANPAAAAALQGVGGTFSCSPPSAVGGVQAATPAVSFDALSWLPGDVLAVRGV